MSWRRICQPRTKGGLDVKDVKLVNLSFLTKWRWRLIQMDNSLWKRVLEDKYGIHIVWYAIFRKICKGFWRQVWHPYCVIVFNLANLEGAKRLNFQSVILTIEFKQRKDCIMFILWAGTKGFLFYFFLKEGGKGFLLFATKNLIDL